MTWIQQKHNNTRWQKLISRLPPLNIHKGPWIAGGSARKLYQGKEWHTGDIDVFFSSVAQRREWQKQFEERFDVQNSVLNPSRSDSSWTSWSLSNCDDVVDMAWREKPSLYANVKVHTDNATTYELIDRRSNGTVGSYEIQVIQARYHDSIEELWKGFDFTISCFAADEEYVYFTPNAAMHLAQNRIVLGGTSNPDNVALRIFKHHVYGFDVDADLLIKSIEMIDNGEYSWTQNY